MTITLTEKQRWFIDGMVQDSEQAKWGFEILLKRDDFASYFEHLQEAGLFNSVNNPDPVSVEDGKYIQVPYWPALGYLEAYAKLAGKHNYVDLAAKVLDVVRKVTKARQANNGQPDNYHTHRIFAEILGLLPLSTISLDDLDLIPIWLDSRFERGMVAHTLDDGLMKRLLESEVPDDWRKACRVLQHCTAITWVEEVGLEKTRKKPVSKVDDYWLKEFISHHAAALGTKVGVEAADILLERLQEVYCIGDRGKVSWLYRPAIEDHKQNHEWSGADNRFVDGLRDVLLVWLNADSINATNYVEILLKHETEIVRRVALYIVNQRWELLHGAFAKIIRPKLFDSGHLHELYGLLKEHFSSFSPGEKASVVDAIRKIPISVNWKEPQINLKRIQRSWLSAIVGQGFEPSDVWFAELEADESLGRLSEHPDFHSYMESWWGSGPTPFRPEQLIEFAKAGSLILQLNAFEPKDLWRGPSKRSLVDALEEAVTIAPEVLLATIPSFIDAQRPYQYGVISGFKRLWETPSEKTSKIIWDQVWPELITFFEDLIGNAEFWAEEVINDRDLTPTRDWIPSLISEFLRSGTRSDDKAYGEDLLPRSWELIRILLERSDAESEVRDDAMTQAINSAKGKAVEALFSHSLRICRLGDCLRNNIHTDEWATIQPVFDSETNKCKNANFEFSTLFGAYLANIEYLNSEWLRANVDKIFSADFPKNFFCAVAGLAYAPAAPSIFRLLAERNILDTALRFDLGERNTRERLIERIAVAYLWGDEDISSPRFVYFFDENKAEDLQVISNFFWSVSNQNLEPAQIQKIFAFWQKCIEWSKKLEIAPVRLLSNLSRLSVYLTKVGKEEADWLKYVAPHINTDYNADEFIEQLLRLVETNPRVICDTFAKVLENYQPTFDYQDKLKNLIQILWDKELKTDAIGFADRLRHLPGMQELYSELISN